MNFITLFNQILILFSIIVLGFVIRKLNIIDDRANDNLSNLVIYVTLPALIIISMNYEFSLERLSNIGITFLITILTYTGMILISYLVVERFKGVEVRDKGIYQFMIIFGNTAFIGYPVIEIIYGSEGIFLAAIYNLGLNIVLWTLGVLIVTRGSKDEAKISFKALINPGIVAVFIGLLIFILSIDLPESIFSLLSMVGGVTTPLALIVVGSTLSQTDLRGIFSDLKIWFIMAIRQLALPIILLLILRPFIDNPMILGVSVVLTGMPVAAITAIFAENYGSNAALASKGVFLGTLLSALTIPILVYLL